MTTSLRDGQLRSAFTAILERLLSSSSDALAAVLVDGEGESVDHAVRIDPARPELSSTDPALKAFDVKLAAAHWQIVVRELLGCRNIGLSPMVSVSADSFGYVIRPLWEGYVLVLVCRPTGLFSVSRRALRQAEVELSHEAALPVPNASDPAWCRVRVRLNSDGVPAAMLRKGSWCEDLSVIAPAGGLTGFERGYLVALSDGQQLTLVREPSGCWYAGCQI